MPVFVLGFFANPWFAPARGEDVPEALDKEVLQQVEVLERSMGMLAEGLPVEQRRQVLERLIRSLEERLANTGLSDTAPIVPKTLQPPKLLPGDSSAEVSAPESPARNAPKLRQRLPCTTLQALDSNDDGKVTSLDRYWRYLYLGVDEDNNGNWSEAEIRSVYERGIREISLGLQSFVRKKGTLGEIRHRGLLIFDVKGNGFGDGQRRPDDGVLMIDTTAMKRTGELEYLGAGGQPLTGIQPFRQGWLLRQGTGQPVELSCPR